VVLVVAAPAVVGKLPHFFSTINLKIY